MPSPHDDAYFGVGADEVDLLDDDDDTLLVAGDDAEFEDDEADVGYDTIDELLVAGDYDDEDEVGFFRRLPRRGGRSRGGGGGARSMLLRRAGGGRKRSGLVRVARQPLIKMPRQVARHLGRKRQSRGDKAISVSTRAQGGPIPANDTRTVESFEVNYDFVVTDLLIYADARLIVTDGRIGEERVMDGEFPVVVFNPTQETRPPVFGVLSSGTSAKFMVVNPTSDEQHFYAVLMGRRNT